MLYEVKVRVYDGPRFGDIKAGELFYCPKTQFVFLKALSPFKEDDVVRFIGVRLNDGYSFNEDWFDGRCLRVSIGLPVFRVEGGPE